MNCVFLILINSIFFVNLHSSSASQSDQVHYLEQDEVYRYDVHRFHSRELRIFCYQGKPKYLVNIWQSVILKINHSTDDYNQFDGTTPDEVRQEYSNQRYSWYIGVFTSKPKNIKFNPFNSSCIGVESRDSYSVQLKVIRIDLWRVLSVLLGIMLFLSAAPLSNNTIFHYLCGVSFGIFASFLILIYFISKLLPKKTLMYGVIGAGWSIVIYFFQMFLDNIRLIMSTYQAYVAWYVVITGSISFILCYRWGPVENPRTMNLIKWSLQLLGLVSIYFSSQFQEAAMAQVILVALFGYLPRTWLMLPKTYWKKRFPPKIKPLTNDEYYEQGVRETAKALQELRQYCSSPKCNQWQTALKLQDVKRFASFIEGNSHLSDNEILEYETSIQAELTEDSDEDSRFSEDEEY
ncbi:hypothetical protein ABEB36_004180 [Hypothenemus hampei]|uniref:Nuclear envelope integral membrane protein 1 n=1 Tax=Hypothenemus hampei TaxID=57062 RepID=A0ABD1F2H1_HYPHA